MVTARPYHHGNLRVALLDAARLLLREQGADALSLRELARRTGVSQAAPYRHFIDRHALLVALAVDGITELTATVRAASGGANLGPLAESYQGFAQHDPALYQLMFSSDTSRDPQVVAACQDLFAELLVRVERPDDEVEDGLRRAASVWAALHGVVRSRLDGVLEWLDPWLQPNPGDVVDVVGEYIAGRSARGRR